MAFTENIDFFLGCVGSDGFGGFFKDLQAGNAYTLYLLKAGPGCGKSTLLRKLCSQSTIPCERIHCSSDPDCLDGVIWSKAHTAAFDATAPHCLEPLHPMLNDYIVNMYNCISPSVLGKSKSEILTVSNQCSALHKQAALHIKAASALLNDNSGEIYSTIDLVKIKAYTQRLIRKYFVSAFMQPAAEHRRFLSAFTPAGYVFFKDTISGCANHIIVFHDDTGAYSSIILNALRNEALKRNYDFYSCYCALNHKKLEHLLIPELGLAFLTGNQWHNFNFPCQKNIHCKRFERTAIPNISQKRIRFNKKLASSLLEHAVYSQAKAKQAHDKLEQLYRTAVDFKKVDEVSAQLLRQLHL